MRSFLCWLLVAVLLTIPVGLVRGGLMKLRAPTLAVLLAGLMVIFLGGMLMMVGVQGGHDRGREESA